MKDAQPEEPMTPAQFYFVASVVTIVGGAWVQHFLYPEDSAEGGLHNPFAWAVIVLGAACLLLAVVHQVQAWRSQLWE